MLIRGSRVAVVGGSIAGCAAAIALRRAGCSVTVYERSGAELTDRGFGIALPVPLRDELAAIGYLPPGMPVRPCRERVWMLRDRAGAAERESPEGRVAWRTPLEASFVNWGLLWRAVCSSVADSVYRKALAVVDVAVDDEGATVTTADGRGERYDVVVGADGYRSLVRGLVDPAARPRFAGYALWRGNYPVADDRTAIPDALAQGTVTVGFPGGHGVFYLIPDFRPSGTRMNWAVYSRVAEASRFTDPTSLPPGSLDDGLTRFLDQLLTDHFPPVWADIARYGGRDSVSLQPIYDVTVARYAAERVLLVGDAAALARPHTGSGATKALQDAIALERVCRTHTTWEKALPAYDDRRRAFGNALVELGRRLGLAQVERTPDWEAMAPAEFESWFSAVVGGRSTPYDR
ncbi:FAD-dependent monooxygenase [Allonocardiopsis opalescens]|uniref:2-polyprenyl-6-methoxyphenol hydroxylase-like FAD-dependent oxidoreductase n=1 Tax=Allonocardiopsis opalescens TaxID=1144618 RepID=A0A2T0PZY4_9ACTN|nr:FAD-dependent monooxygenase [Allonocardiopsis opalescens]PRX97100.1 2-polyprenyl-6-methoxyphenol hydroxylase-like FAD-dependent oxidoreductase [Allonocardiopsis opalescens]